MKSKILVGVALLMSCGRLGHGDDWTGWRGPRGDGVSRETGWSAKWPKTGPKILWKAELGVPANNKDGSSTVAVSGDRVFVMGTGHVFCLNANTGMVIWKNAFTASHSTPAVDSGRVYVYGTQGRLDCLDAKTGKVIWKRDMIRDLGAARAGGYGYAASPVVTGDLVLVSARIDGGALVAFDKVTGKTRWKAAHACHRKYAFWSSPVPTRIGGEPQIVWLAGPSVVGLNPANGKTLWKYGIPPENNKIGCAAATPVVSGTHVVAQYHPPHARGYTFCLEIKANKATLAWKTRTLANWYFSCVGYQGRLYGADQAPRNRNRAERDIGTFHCHDIATGKLLWSINGFGQSGKRPVRSTRNLRAAGTFLIADGKIVAWGNELVVAAITGAGHKVLASAKLRHTGYRTMPVIANGRLYLRAKDGPLLCLDVRGKPAE